MFCFFFQAEDGIRDLVRSRGLGDVYKRQRQVVGDLRLHRHRERTTGLADAFGVGHTRAALALSLIHI